MERTESILAASVAGQELEPVGLPAELARAPVLQRSSARSYQYHDSLTVRASSVVSGGERVKRQARKCAEVQVARNPELD